MKTKLLMLFICLSIGTGICAAQQDSAFTFQGKLNDGGTAANGNYEMAFRVYDDVNAGTQIGSTVTVNNVQVANGIFSVELDFSHLPFITVSQRFLQIAIRPAGSSASFTMLSPRQKITSAPFASQSFNANMAAVANIATNVSCTECVEDDEIESVSGNKVTGVVNEAATVSSGAGAGILNVSSFVGLGSNIIGASTDYVFVGPTTDVTLSNIASRRVTGSASVSLSGSASIRYGVCYQVLGSGGLLLFNGISLLGTVTSTRSSFSYSGSALLPLGTHPVGFCVRNSGSTITGVEFVSGWVMAPK